MHERAETCGLPRNQFDTCTVLRARGPGARQPAAMARDSVLIERGDHDMAVVVLSGEHDAYGAPRLEEQVMSLLSEDLSIVIDLTFATFLDSVTLFLLL